jgi:hypothetical protein
MSDADKERPAPRDMQDLQEDVDQMIAQAEAHLGVAHGTIADVAKDNDYLAILKIHATIEPLINELLKENITRVLTHPKVNFPGADTLAEFVLARNLDEKRTLALKSELITNRWSEFIRNVANVRNRYVHNIKNIPLSISEIAQKISPNDGGGAILRSLGNTKQVPEGAILRIFMYWNFGFLLSEVIKGIKPPEVGNGILSAELRKLSPRSDQENDID